MWRITVVALLATLGAQHVVAVCNQCKDGFTCVSETEFQLCLNNQPITNETYSCPNEDEICTKFAKICMPRDSTAVPACRGLQNCVCDDAVNFQFVCTSRTTYTMCFNGTYTTTRGTCPANQICNVQKAANNEYPCGTQCIEDVDNAVICDFIDPVDLPAPATTEAPTSNSTASETESPSSTVATDTTVIISPTPSNTPNEVCGNQTTAGRYPVPNDTGCTTYIYCYLESNRLVGRTTPCPSGRYFNRDIRNCQVAKPSWCV